MTTNQNFAEPLEPVYTVETAAGPLTGRSASALRMLIFKGRLKVIRSEGRVLLPHREVLRLRGESPNTD
jgi:hypothetical protein